MTDKKRMTSLLKDLIATNSESPPGGEKEVADVLRNHMEAHGIACVSVGPSDRPNLIFSSQEGEIGPLVMHGHMDTVPAGPSELWTHDPFGGEIVEGKMYGRGACDMKGPVTALVETLILYSEEKHDTPLLVLTTSDEETGCTGAEKVATSGRLEGVKFGVCAEPTNLGVYVGEKGILWSKVVAKGEAAHGSRPDEGVNAIELCVDAVRVLTGEKYPFEEDPLLGEHTMSLGTINGGVKINVVPAQCEAQLDMRLVKGQTPDSVLEQMRARIIEAGLSERVQVEYVHGKKSVRTPENEEIVKVSLDAVEKVTGNRPSLSTATYGTDCSVLQPEVGILHVICGPGSIEQAHQPDEFIPMDQFYDSVDIYLDIARHFSGRL
ncbi:MAG: M20 family metallopeptidase [Candidatus Thorarchaeota archaeon]|jgi:acetylornithine deacetylase/succinyl-diaminopimelate desuccinylase family protein